jgi:hypothetical protein
VLYKRYAIGKEAEMQVAVNYSESAIEDAIGAPLFGGGRKCVNAPGNFDFKEFEAVMAENVHQVAPDADVAINNLDRNIDNLNRSEPITKGFIEIQDNNLNKAVRDDLTDRIGKSIDAIDFRDSRFNYGVDRGDHLRVAVKYSVSDNVRGDFYFGRYEAAMTDVIHRHLPGVDVVYDYQPNGHTDGSVRLQGNQERGRGSVEQIVQDLSDLNVRDSRFYDEEKRVDNGQEKDEHLEIDPNPAAWGLPSRDLELDDDR